MKLIAMVVLLAFALLAAAATLTMTITVVVHQSQVDLVWAASTSTGVTGYNVYRSITSGTGYVKIGTTAGLSYNDLSLSPGTYYYVVTATNTSGESAYSLQVSAVVH